MARRLEGRMITVSRSLHIDAPIERVFALMADARARAALSPHTKVVRVDVEGGGLLRPGAVCRFVLKRGNQKIEYHMRVIEFVENERIVSVAETAVPFTVRIDLKPEEGGTRLMQSESFEPTEAMLREAMTEAESRSLLSVVSRMLLWMDSEAAIRLRYRQEAQLRQLLERRLDDWLRAIKTALEATPDSPGH